MRVDSPQLIRLLAGLEGTPVHEPRQSFAERLGQWLAVTDAVPLSAVLNAPSAPAARDAASRAQASAGSGSPERLTADAARAALAALRAALADSPAADGRPERGKSAIRLPEPEPTSSKDGAADFAPYRRYYMARQREMAARIDPLRRQLRAALARQSLPLRRLAALDAVFEQALADRERSLLATVPGVLGRRFELLYKAHRATLEDSAANDDPARWLGPGGWLTAFCAEMHAVARAELELRLQPLDGLAAALDNEATA